MNLRCFRFVFLLFFLFFINVGCSAALGDSFRGRVVAVIDGDTLTVSGNRTVRLCGVDAPEIGRKGAPSGFFAVEAARRLQELVKGRAVRVDRVSEDRYGRTVGIVWLDNDSSINEKMVAEGLAYYYYHSDIPESLRERLLSAQRTAILQRVGFWPEVLSVMDTRGPFIGNRRSRRFHTRDCRSGRQVSARNVYRFETAEEAFSSGYSPARHCSAWPLHKGEGR